MRTLVLSVLLAATASAQAPDSLAAGGPTFRPVQTSAPIAYLASVGATGALVGTGLLLDAVLPDPPPRAYDDGTHHLYESGKLLTAIGVLLGPSVGNLTLGAADDVGRAYVIKSAGIAVGGGLLLLSLGTAAGCVVTSNGGCSAASPLLTMAVVAAAGGVAAGTVYDLATIPRNAARARRAGPHLRPLFGLRGGTPVLGLRATL